MFIFYLRGGHLGIETTPPEPLWRPVRYAGGTPTQMAQVSDAGGSIRHHTLEEGCGNVQAAFLDGTLADKSMWQTVVFIPKGDVRDFQEIGLVEVLCKTIMGLPS